MTELLPILRQVVVPGTPAAAFEVFTIEIGLWWPLADHSVYGEGGSVGFQDGRLVERGPDGGEAVWGTVLSWVPEQHVHLTWHPGSDPAKASEVEVRFQLAQTDDLSVVRGLLQVRVQPWHVVLEGLAPAKPRMVAFGTAGVTLANARGYPLGKVR